MEYKDLVEALAEELIETKISNVYKDENGHVVIVAKGGNKVFQGGSRTRTARMKVRQYTPSKNAGEDWEDVPLGQNLTIDQMNKPKEEKKTENVNRIVDHILSEAGIQKLVFKTAADAEEHAAHRAFVNAQKKAAGEDPRALYSDPQIDLQRNPLKTAKMDRLNFLKDAVEKRSTPVKGGSSRQPIGDRTVRSMSDEISQLESELGLSGPRSKSSVDAKKDLDSLFGGNATTRSAGAQAFDALFKG